jgi:transposase
LRHGLLKCKICNGLWNRDVNSSLNIFKIVENKIAGKERPVYLQRKQIVSNTTSVLHNQILDDLAIDQL